MSVFQSCMQVLHLNLFFLCHKQEKFSTKKLKKTFNHNLSFDSSKKMPLV